MKLWALFLVSGCSAFETDNEFIRGAQTGMQIMLNNLDDAVAVIEDYSCEPPTFSGKFASYANMVKNTKSVIQMVSPD